jgi:WD40 repeat protein
MSPAGEQSTLTSPSSPSLSRHSPFRSDDSSVKVWDWEKGVPDVVYADNEHLSDVKCAEWHPFRSLIATGSKDNTVKLWDPREDRSLRLSVSKFTTF